MRAFDFNVDSEFNRSINGEDVPDTDLPEGLTPGEALRKSVIDTIGVISCAKLGLDAAGWQLAYELLSTVLGKSSWAIALSTGAAGAVGCVVGMYLGLLATEGFEKTHTKENLIQGFQLFFDAAVTGALWLPAFWSSSSLSGKFPFLGSRYFFDAILFPALGAVFHGVSKATYLATQKGAQCFGIKYDGGFQSTAGISWQVAWGEWGFNAAGYSIFAKSIGTTMAGRIGAAYVGTAVASMIPGALQSYSLFTAKKREQDPELGQMIHDSDSEFSFGGL